MMHFEGHGKLIVFEGIDGCGKTTQLQLLADVLTDQGLPVISTREPTEGPFGQKIRKLYQNRESVSRRTELELFINDRREHVQELLGPSIAAGKIILCDRYVLSTVAYQGAAGMDVDEIFLLNDFAPSPDLALLFQIQPDTSIARITDNRQESLNDFEQADALAKVAKIFDALDLPYIRKIDASGTIATVHQAVLREVASLIEQYKSR
jgi:dTMP kinase